MSSVLRPRGPQSSSVYWRRRAVALAIVLAIPMLVIVLFAWGGSSEPEPQAAEPEPTASGAPGEVVDEPAPEEEPAAPESAEASPAAEPATSACGEEDMAVVVRTDAGSYAADAKPEITMTITNASGTDCVRNIGAGANEIVVTSGGYHVWSSDDCDPSQTKDEQVLPAGVDAATNVTWDRVLSAPGCAGSSAPAQSGTYEVTGRNGATVSEPVRFVLE